MLKFLNCFSSKNKTQEEKSKDIHLDIQKSSTISQQEKSMVDCRSYQQKKHEVNDKDLENYLNHESSKKRRNGLCEEICKDDSSNQFVEFQVYLWRELYSKSFII